MILLFQSIVYPFILHLIGLAVGLFMHVVISSCFFYRNAHLTVTDWVSCLQYLQQNHFLFFFFSLWQCNTLNWLITVNRGPINQSLSSAGQSLTDPDSISCLLINSVARRQSKSCVKHMVCVKQCNLPFPESLWDFTFESLFIFYYIIGAVSTVWTHTEQAL